MLTRWLSLLIAAVALLAAHLPAQARIWDSVPDEQLQALQLSREASPKELFEALSKRYKAELNKGKLARYWEPIPMDMYLAPSLFYKPPDVNIDVTREQCVSCHTSVTHGWVKTWEKSVHANLDAIRQLPASDVRAYKKDIIAEVEEIDMLLSVTKQVSTLAKDVAFGPFDFELSCTSITRPLSS